MWLNKHSSPEIIDLPIIVSKLPKPFCDSDPEVFRQSLVPEEVKKSIIKIILFGVFPLLERAEVLPVCLKYVKILFHLSAMQLS